MTVREQARQMTRRELLRGGVVVAGGTLLPAWVVRAAGATLQQAAGTREALAARRATLGAIPIQQTKLTDALTLLSGPGGNVVVLSGPDGKIVVDSFVQPAWNALKQTLDGLGAAPVKTLIDTHWHYDHADNNGNFHNGGAAVLAHQNTRKRLTESHDLLGMHFDPVPPEALPTQTFDDKRTLEANGERLALGHIPPSHTDTDIYIHYSKGNVLHLGDVFFNGMYPFFDTSTGGNINGMIGGADMALKMADGRTKIVPGHGPLGDKAALTQYRDMLVTVRDRVRKLKSGGKSLDEAIAANPTADLDATWGKGFMQAKDFVSIVYNTL